MQPDVELIMQVKFIFQNLTLLMWIFISFTPIYSKELFLESYNIFHTKDKYKVDLLSENKIRSLYRTQYEFLAAGLDVRASDQDGDGVIDHKDRNSAQAHMNQSKIDNDAVRHVSDPTDGNEEEAFPVVCGDTEVALPTLCHLGANTPTDTVSSSSALREVLSSARAGDVISVRDGRYRGNFDLTRDGRAAEPIVIRGNGDARFTDSVITISGDYAVITGLVLVNSMIVITGDNNRVTKNLFRDGEPGGNSSTLHSAVAIQNSGSFNRVDHNEIRDWERRGLRVIRLNDDTRCNRFDHNYLHDFVGTIGNAGEAFQVGIGRGDFGYDARTYIEYNLVDHFELELEILSLKSNRNVIRKNTFKNSSIGALTTRAGSDNVLRNNYIEDIVFMAVYADNNQIIGSQFVNSGLTVRSGDATYEELFIRESNGDYRYRGAHRATNSTLVYGNDFIGSNAFMPDGLLTVGERFYHILGEETNEYDRYLPATDNQFGANNIDVVEVGEPDWVVGARHHTLTSDEICPVENSLGNQFRVLNKVRGRVQYARY